MIQEEEKNKLEAMKLKEWEEQFDREQRMKEHREILKDERLKQRENKELVSNDTNLGSDLSSKLESFDVDKSSEHLICIMKIKLNSG